MRDWRAEARQRLAALGLPPTRQAEVVEELALHMEDRYHEAMAGGASEDEATRSALAEVADGMSRQDALRGQKRRPELPEERGGSWLADLAQDVRYGVRALVRSPGFACAAVLTMALGIGANTAVFSVLQAVVLKPLPFPEPDRLVEVWGTKPERNWGQVSLSHANFWDFRDRNRTFEDMGAMSFTSANLMGSEHPERLKAALVSVGFFRALGAVPTAGRIFVAGEDEPREDHQIALLSHRLWTDRFAADPSVVGRVLTLDDRPTVVVGVLPAGTPALDAALIFLPLVHRADADRGSFDLNVLGRLKTGVSFEAAQEDLRRVAAELALEYPETNQGLGAGIGSSRDWAASPSMRRGLWVVMGAVGFLLLIACVNLVNLLLARAASRTRELAVRSALGASRSRIVRQWLAESLVLGLLGAGLGLVLVVALLDGLRSLGAGQVPRLAEVHLDRPVLAFTAALALLTSLGAGLVSAFRTPLGILLPGLREGERGASAGPRQKRLRSLLVGTEVALSLVLLVGAGLLLRSFEAVVGVERGFGSENRLLLEVALPPSYDEPRASRFIVEMESRAAQLPGVLSAAAVSTRPFGDWNTGLGIGAVGDTSTGDVPWASWRLVTPDYFKTLGVPLLKGRVFTPHDTAGKPWQAVISRRLADLLWPGQDPIGRQALLWKGQSSRPAEVIGVVGDIRERGLARDPTLAVYLPFNGFGAMAPVQFVLHTRTPAATLVPLLRQSLASLDPKLPISGVQTMEEIVTESLGPRRFVMLLLVVFAGLALVLALGGVAGVLAYSVAGRTVEVGIRLALGASFRQVVTMIVAQGMAPVSVGIGIGVAASVGLSRLLDALLFGVTPYDPLTYVAVVMMLAVAAVIACLAPAWGAKRVDVVSALRAD